MQARLIYSNREHSPTVTLPPNRQLIGPRRELLKIQSNVERRYEIRNRRSAGRLATRPEVTIKHLNVVGPRL